MVSLTDSVGAQRSRQQRRKKFADIQNERDLHHHHHHQRKSKRSGKEKETFADLRRDVQSTAENMGRHFGGVGAGTGFEIGVELPKSGTPIRVRCIKFINSWRNLIPYVWGWNGDDYGGVERSSEGEIEWNATWESIYSI